MGVEVVTDILLAAYQGERYLPGLLASLAAQTEKDFRVLMQDDGSNDSTLALLEAQRDKDARFVLVEDERPERKKGAIGNFWSLLGQSEGAYTALCDQDDLWHPGRLRDTMAAMGAAELRWGKDTPILVHSDCRVVDAQGQPIHPSFFRHQGWDPRAVSLAQLLVQNNVTGCTVLINRPLRELALGHGDPEQMHMHDWFLGLTAAAFGHVVFVDEPLVDYRQHGNNEMGASGASLTTRGVKALSARERGKARMELTFRHTAAFAKAYQDCLRGEAQRTVEGYLALERKGKLGRGLGMLRGGYLMQSWITRVGQLIFC